MTGETSMSERASARPWRHVPEILSAGHRIAGRTSVILGPDGETIADCHRHTFGKDERCPEGEANAALIVESVNAHASLLEENKRLREALKPFADFADHCTREHPGWDHDAFTVSVTLTESCNFPKMDAFRRARAALSSP